MREYKTLKDLRKEAKVHSEKARQYFQEADDLREIRKRTNDPAERLKLELEMLEKGRLGVAEVEKAIKLGERFIKDLRRIGKRNTN